MDAECSRARQQRFSLRDHLRIPQRRVLRRQRNILAARQTAGATPRFRVKHQRKQTQSFRLLRNQLGHQPARNIDSSVRSRRAASVPPGSVHPSANAA